MPESRSATADAALAPAPRVYPSRARRALLNALAVLLIYGNATIALQPPRLRRTGFQLPAPAWMRDAFLMSGMFTTWSRSNLDMFIAGQRSLDGDPSTRGQWVSITVREHFPDRQGVTFTKLYAMHHWDAHGRAAQRVAWKALARKIREHHNRLHPELAVTRVRFGSVEWPQSPLGYRAAKHARSIETRVWYEERP